MRKKIVIWFEDSSYFSLILIGGAAALAALQLYFRPLDAHGYSAYNNFMIFRSSAELFWAKANLYQLHPQFYFDQYKYSPLFALLMSPFLKLPVLFGLLIFAFVNVYAVWKSLTLIPELSPYKINAIMLFSSFELLGSIQNMQTNALLVGLFIASFQFSRSQKPLSAVTASVLNLFLKIFGGLSFLFIIFAEGLKAKAKYFFYSIAGIALAVGIPILFSSIEYQKNLWLSWLSLLKQDQATNIGYSLQGIISAWFDLRVSGLYLLAFGSFLIVALLFKISWRTYKSSSQNLALLGLLLIWLVLFNPRSESPSFVIATVGIALCFIAFRVTSKRAWWSCFVLTSLVHSDLLPATVRHEWVEPYLVKVVPSLLVFLWAFRKMLKMKLEKV